ncbi:M15 family metallopeptidase [Blautia producta]|nr:M15 family metallopeptidase [Blautia producta]MCB5873770.1 M15 family metallopeptidase [Blautia producta]
MLPGVRWDAQYAAWDNFSCKPVGGYRMNRIVGTKGLGDTLCKTQKLAMKHEYLL